MFLPARRRAERFVVCVFLEEPALKRLSVGLPLKSGHDLVNLDLASRECAELS